MAVKAEASVPLVTWCPGPWHCSTSTPAWPNTLAQELSEWLLILITRWDFNGCICLASLSSCLLVCLPFVYLSLYLSVSLPFSTSIVFFFQMFKKIYKWRVSSSNWTCYRVWGMDHVPSTWWVTTTVGSTFPWKMSRTQVLALMKRRRIVMLLVGWESFCPCSLSLYNWIREMETKVCCKNLKAVLIDWMLDTISLQLKYMQFHFVYQVEFCM